MDKLSEQQIDKELIDRDERKPVRKLVDDHIIPIGGLAVGGAAAAVGALGQLKTVDRTHTIS